MALLLAWARDAPCKHLCSGNGDMNLEATLQMSSILPPSCWWGAPNAADV